MLLLLFLAKNDISALINIEWPLSRVVKFCNIGPVACTIKVLRSQIYDRKLCFSLERHLQS